MGSRQLFVTLNGLAALFTPALILLGRILGQNGGWMIFILMLGGFLVYHVVYLIFLILSLGLSDSRSPVYTWLIATWVLG